MGRSHKEHKQIARGKAKQDKQQGTQRNAAVASETAEIANSTSDMAKAIVAEANEANFIGKGSVQVAKVEKKQEQVFERKTRQLSSSSTQPQPTKSVEPVKTTPNKVVSATNSSDDEWESF